MELTGWEDGAAMGGWGLFKKITCIIGSSIVVSCDYATKIIWLCKIGKNKCVCVCESMCIRLAYII